MGRPRKVVADAAPKEPRPSKLHVLKCWPKFFKAIVSGEKTFELRKNDRDFRVEDTLLLMEYDPETKEYTGEQVRVCVRTLENLDGLCVRYCLMQIAAATNVL